MVWFSCIYSRRLGSRIQLPVCGCAGCRLLHDCANDIVIPLLQLLPASYLTYHATANSIGLILLLVFLGILVIIAPITRCPALDAAIRPPSLPRHFGKCTIPQLLRLDASGDNNRAICRLRYVDQNSGRGKCMLARVVGLIA